VIETSGAGDGLQRHVCGNRRSAGACRDRCRADAQGEGKRSRRTLERDDFSSNQSYPALSFCLSMIFSEKPVPHFSGSCSRGGRTEQHPPPAVPQSHTVRNRRSRGLAGSEIGVGLGRILQRIGLVDLDLGPHPTEPTSKSSFAMATRFSRLPRCSASPPAAWSRLTSACWRRRVRSTSPARRFKHLRRQAREPCRHGEGAFRGRSVGCGQDRGQPEPIR